MWADTLQAFERAHLLRLAVWGAASILAGSAILAWLRVGSHRSVLLWHFALQCAAWGTVDGAIALAQWSRVVARDMAGATRLDRLLWLNIGLEAGCVLVGVTLALTGWRLGRRLGLVGAGIGVVVQGSALVVLDLVLAAQISR
jgi:hypothetical protein